MNNSEKLRQYAEADASEAGELWLRLLDAIDFIQENDYEIDHSPTMLKILHENVETIVLYLEDNFKILKKDREIIVQDYRLCDNESIDIELKDGWEIVNL